MKHSIEKCGVVFTTLRAQAMADYEEEVFRNERRRMTDAKIERIRKLAKALHVKIED